MILHILQEFLLGNPIKLDYFAAYLASYIRLLRSNLRFQSLIGLTPERKVDYFFCM